VLVARAFFRAGFSDSIVIAAYRLAKHFGQHPDSFLQKTPTEIRRYLYWTNEMVRLDTEIQDAERTWRNG
jgi:hypothetical protein